MGKKFNIVLFVLLMLLFSAVTVEGAVCQAEMERGEKLIYPNDLGDHFTYFYRVQGKPVYCLQSSVKSPESGNYAGKILEENEDLRQVLYYGYGGPEDITLEFYPEYSDDVRYILTHIAASYVYCGDAALKGCTEEGMKKYRIKAYIDRLLETKIPEDNLVFACKDRQCFRDGNIQRTRDVHLKGASDRTVRINFPDGVSVHFKGKEEKAESGQIDLKGGDIFYLEFPLMTKGEFLLGGKEITERTEWKLVVLTTGEKTQDIGYGEYFSAGRENPSILFSHYEYYPSLLIEKIDAEDGCTVSGAEFVLKTEDGSCVETWTSSGEPHRINQVQPGNYIIEELKVPTGYVCMEPQTVTITEDIPEVVVKAENRRLYGKIIMQKVDKDSKKPLQGVQFAIINKGTQEVLEILETDETGRAESGPLPVWNYENGEAKEKITYLVREIRPADGYLQPEQDTEADCTRGKIIANIQELYLELENERIPEMPTPMPAPTVYKAPKTGDDSSLLGYTILMILTAFSGFLIWKKCDILDRHIFTNNDKIKH